VIDAQQRQIGAALRQRWREAVDREGQLFGVREFDLVRDDAVVQTALAGECGDVALQRFAAMQLAESVNGKVFQ